MLSLFPETQRETVPALNSERRGSAAYRPDIDGLRAIAILSVVLYHGGVWFLPGGFTGVDIFFVISGFVITGLLLRERYGTGAHG